MFNNWSWKQTNASFEDFLVGNHGWCIKGQMLRKFIWYPKSIFRFIRTSMCISKWIKWIKIKSQREKKNLHFFSIPSSSRHEKCCRMSQRIYCLFQCSRNYLCKVYQNFIYYRESYWNIQKHTERETKKKPQLSQICWLQYTAWQQIVSF